MNIENIILFIILGLLIIILFLKNKIENFDNHSEHINKNDIINGLSARLDIVKNRIINLNVIGDLENNEEISISFDLLPENPNNNEKTNEEVLEDIKKLVNVGGFYISVGNKNINITIQEGNNFESEKTVNESKNNTQNNTEKNSFSDTEKNPNELLNDSKEIISNKKRGVPYNHNLERNFTINYIDQTLIEPGVLIIEEDENNNDNDNDEEDDGDE